MTKLNNEDIFESEDSSIPVWWLKKDEDEHLTPAECLMVAVYERALKDWMQCITSNNLDKWEMGYDAVQWFLSDDDSKDYCSFGYVCEILSWNPVKIRKRTAEVFDMSVTLMYRSRLLAAVNCYRNIKNKRWKKAYKVLAWIMSDSEDEGSFIAACKHFNIPAEETRDRLSKSFKTLKTNGYFKFLKNKKFNIIG